MSDYGFIQRTEFGQAIVEHFEVRPCCCGRASRRIVTGRHDEGEACAYCDAIRNPQTLRIEG